MNKPKKGRKVALLAGLALVVLFVAMVWTYRNDDYADYAPSQIMHWVFITTLMGVLAVVVLLVLALVCARSLPWGYRQSLVDDLHMARESVDLDRLRAKVLEPEGQQVFLEVLLEQCIEGFAFFEKVPAELATKDFAIMLVGQSGGSTTTVRASDTGRVKMSGSGSGIALSLEYLDRRIDNDVDVKIYGTRMKVSILSTVDAIRVFERQANAIRAFERRAKVVLKDIERRIGEIALVVRRG